MQLANQIKEAVDSEGNALAMVNESFDKVNDKIYITVDTIHNISREIDALNQDKEKVLEEVNSPSAVLQEKKNLLPILSFKYRMEKLVFVGKVEMGNELSEMPLEELWELFPIFLVAHNDKWNLYYDEIQSFLKIILSEYPIERISHIGSTAISGIWAKDIVDVLIEVSKDSDIENTAKVIEKNGFIRMSTEAGRISFNRGYTKEGFADKVFHVHLRYVGDNDELYFRDYLNEHTQIAREYETLKLQLWKLFEHNRDAYTDAKAEFIRKWTAEAKKVYAGRY